MDHIATICAEGCFLAQILADPEDNIDCDAIHGLYKAATVLWRMGLSPCVPRYRPPAGAVRRAGGEAMDRLPRQHIPRWACAGWTKPGRVPIIPAISRERIRVGGTP